MGDEELTTKQIYERMLMQTSPTSDLTFRQLTNVLGAYFDKVGFDKKTTCIINNFTDVHPVKFEFS